MIETIFKHNRIIIIGYPKSGKTTLFKTLSSYDESKTYYLLQTDDYIGKHSYKQTLYEIIEDLKGKKKYIVEGIQGYRLLRKISELNLLDMKPDLIINCITDRPIQQKHLKQIKGLNTIWNQYLSIERDLPKIIESRN